MTTNREWLESLAASDVVALNAWFDSEHMDAHLKPQSKTEPKLSELFGILSDANDVFGGESDVMVQPVDANNTNATCNNSGENVTHDSREKLEADIDEYIECEYGIVPGIVAMVPEWLDRQAAITAHQWESYHNGMMREWIAKTEELQAQVDELQAHVNELTAEVDNLTDELAKRDKGIARLKQRRDELLSQLNDLTASYDLICRAFDAQRALLKHERGAEQ